MMNRYLGMVLVRDHDKTLVIEAFTAHRVKYVIDETERREFLTAIKMLE